MEARRFCGRAFLLGKERRRRVCEKENANGSRRFIQFALGDERGVGLLVDIGEHYAVYRLRK